MRSLKLTATTAMLALLLIMVIDGCKKPVEFFDRINTGSGDANRKVVVKFRDAVAGDIILRVRDVTPTSEQFVLIELSRDASSAADLNKALTVKLTKNPTLIANYNSANGTSYIELPAAAYQIEDISNITFDPGQFIKQVKITINKALMDLSLQYALGYTISAVGEGGWISSDAHDALYGIGLKNQFDGVYTLKNRFYHPASANPATNLTINVEMWTSGANSVKIFSPDFGGYYHPWRSGAGAITAFSAQEPKYTIDATTNAVTVQNSYSGAVTFYMMGPGYTSRYDPATKTIYAKFGYNYLAGPTFDPTATREFIDTLTYLGPR